MLIRLSVLIDTRGIRLRAKADVLGITLPEMRAFFRWFGEPRLFVGFHWRQWAVFSREILHKKPQKRQTNGRYFNALRRSSTLRSLSARVCVGFEDAAATAVCAGLLWAAMAPLGTWATHGGIAPTLDVQPDFHAPGFSARLACMFEVRVGQLIHALVFQKRSVRHAKSHAQPNAGYAQRRAASH